MKSKIDAINTNFVVLKYKEEEAIRKETGIHCLYDSDGSEMTTQQ